MRTKTLWKNICQRTNPNSAEVRRYPNYLGTENLFESYQVFESWCVEQEGFGLLDSSGKAFALDKDLAILCGDIDTKAYGTHCVFLPSKLNNVVRISNGRGSLLPGVTTYHDGRYRMQYMDIEGKRYHGGIFNTEQQAHDAWRAVKSDILLQASQIANDFGLTKAAGMFLKASDKF